MGFPNNPDWVGDLSARAGSFKIAADGRVIRFPGVPGQLLAAAERLAAQRYSERYGSLEGTQLPELR